MTDALSTSALEALEKLEKEASQGEWRKASPSCIAGVGRFMGTYTDHCKGRENVDLVIALRNLAPSLIAEAKKAQGYRELVEEVAKDKCKRTDMFNLNKPCGTCLPCRANELIK